MSLVTRSGILLRSHPYSETSRILRVLTSEGGIVSLMAKGVRSSASKGGGGLDHFSTLEVVYYDREGRDLHTLKEFRTTRARGGIGREVLRFAAAAFLAELVLGHTLQEGNPELYRGLEEGLEALTMEPTESIPGLLLSVGWRLLSDLGFPPALTTCIGCGRPIPAGEALARFDPGGGGLLGPECAEEGEGARLGPGAREELRAIVAGEPPTPVRRPDVHFRLMERFALHHLDRTRPFRSTGTLLPLLEKEVEEDPS